MPHPDASRALRNLRRQQKTYQHALYHHHRQRYAIGMEEPETGSSFARLWLNSPLTTINRSTSWTS